MTAQKIKAGKYLSTYSRLFLYAALSLRQKLSHLGRDIFSLSLSGKLF